jgi:hypothetical protein
MIDFIHATILFQMAAAILLVGVAAAEGVSRSR